MILFFQAVKQAYDVLGRLGQDYHRRGIEVFRAMDADGDMRVDEREFLSACLGDEELGRLLESGLGGEGVWGGGGKRTAEVKKE